MSIQYAAMIALAVALGLLLASRLGWITVKSA